MLRELEVEAGRSCQPGATSPARGCRHLRSKKRLNNATVRFVAVAPRPFLHEPARTVVNRCVRNAIAVRSPNASYCPRKFSFLPRKYSHRDKRQLIVAEKLNQLRGILVDRERQENESLVSILKPDPVYVWKFLHTRAAPGGVEMEHHHRAATLTDRSDGLRHCYFPHPVRQPGIPCRAREDNCSTQQRSPQRRDCRISRGAH